MNRKAGGKEGTRGWNLVEKQVEEEGGQKIFGARGREASLSGRRPVGLVLVG
jgi:hypothetical protein